MFSLCTGISLYLPIILPLVSTCLLYVLLFPYIFLLFDCFEWALIDHIEKCRGQSVLWQFQTGGSCQFYLGKSENLSSPAVISLYLPII